MSTPPAYFEAIRATAARRWAQLEADKDLAAPWHQLFRQVQSPRHVLSELLQNADDACATEAAVRIEGDVFIFEHDGEDFSEDHFASLCRFGYSNKRALHTIGFRGIGFKSVFSLGDLVEVRTPSIAVAFSRSRFTEPVWLSDTLQTKRTQIRVRIKDAQRRNELEKNFDDWVETPLSLLFFKNVRRLIVGERDVHWGTFGAGPVPDSEWMALYENDDDIRLIVRSSLEAFPEDALDEIREERMLGKGDEMEFPPCRVEIVLGARGRLYVVLPTGVETSLPFACNAPFIQDPARLKIKDPDISPTNRWLLARAGKTAAAAMVAWLSDRKASTKERVGAYDLLPDVAVAGNSLESDCATIVRDAFAAQLAGSPILLTATGDLVPARHAVRLPPAIAEVWPTAKASALFDETERPALASSISAPNCEKLVRAEFVEEIDLVSVLNALCVKNPPKPASWAALLDLWDYLAPDMLSYAPSVAIEELRIFPAQGKETLYAASEIVRLGEAKLLNNDDDWVFLSDHLVVLNQNWGRYLADRRRVTMDEDDTPGLERVEQAYACMEEVGLGEASDASTVMDRVAADFFAHEEVGPEACVRIAHIAAKLEATAGPSFRFVTRDLALRGIDQDLLYDEDGSLERLIPPEQIDNVLVHDEYAKNCESCSEKEWSDWVKSGRSGLLTFPPFSEIRTGINGASRIYQITREKGVEGEISFPYVTDGFRVDDWDFRDELWKYWATLAVEDAGIWGAIATAILSQRTDYWTNAKAARLQQVATTHRLRSLIYTGTARAAWVVRLRTLPCLRDTRGTLRKPYEMLRRTPATESFMDVEPFIDARLDNEAARPLLDLLGVRSQAPSAEALLNCLRTLAKSQDPPVRELEKWYHRIDQLLNDCSTAVLQSVKDAFKQEKLILTAEGNFETSDAVYLDANEESVPGTATIANEVAELSLWAKLGVAQLPSADSAIEWLKRIPSGQALSPDDTRRVVALISRYPFRVWRECEHWLNLAGEWAPTKDLSYALTMQSLTSYTHLHPWVKTKTANLQRLSTESLNEDPFSSVPTLAKCVQERVREQTVQLGEPEQKEWARALGRELSRVLLASDSETTHIREHAARLERTRWVMTRGLEIIPYIEGTPAGIARKAEVVWEREVLFQERLSVAKLAKRVPEEIGKIFGNADVKAALDYSFDRSPAEIRAYVEGNFELDPTFLDLPARDEAKETTSGPPKMFPSAEAAPAGAVSTTQGNEALLSDCETGHAVGLTPTPIADLDNIESSAEMVGGAPGTSAPKMPRLSIMERFARDRGFYADGDSCFVKTDGSTLVADGAALKVWELRDSNGTVVRRFIPKDHCLEKRAMEIDADQWMLVQRHADHYALILSDIEGQPIELSGADLMKMTSEGTLKVHPAAYRLVHSNGD